MGAVAFGGARILTMDPALPDPEVVVCRGGRIAAVGERGLLAAHPDAEQRDLGGRTLVPGFIDAHNHLSVAALHPRWADVSSVASLEELLDAVRAQAAAEPDTEWVRVVGWNETVAGVTPTRRDLDGLGLDRPVVVAHYSLHQAVVCSQALDRLGVGRHAPDPEGGEIGRAPDGTPNGLLVERAWSEAHARSLAAYGDPDRWAAHIEARGRQLLTEGITAVHDAACSPAAEAVYRALASQGRLPLSVLMMPHAATLLSNEPPERGDAPATGEGTEELRVGPQKLFADGGVAIALDVAIGGQPVRYGIAFRDVVGRIEDAVERGFRVAVHAIGNAGLALALEGFGRVDRRWPDDDHRFRVEHVGVCDRAQVAALADLGALGVVQPGFVEHVAAQTGGVRFDDHHWLAFGDLAEAGVGLAGSSDDPCAPFPPLWCAARGDTRSTTGGLALEPGQRVPFADWLSAYTTGGAFAGGQEAERGSITPGKRADLVVLSGALLPEPLPTVDETWVAGECRYRR